MCRNVLTKVKSTDKARRHRLHCECVTCSLTAMSFSRVCRILQIGAAYTQHTAHNTTPQRLTYTTNIMEEEDCPPCVPSPNKEKRQPRPKRSHKEMASWLWEHGCNGEEDGALKERFNLAQRTLKVVRKRVHDEAKAPFFVDNPEGDVGCADDYNPFKMLHQADLEKLRYKVNSTLNQENVDRDDLVGLVPRPIYDIWFSHKQVERFSGKRDTGNDLEEQFACVGTGDSAKKRNAARQNLKKRMEEFLNDTQQVMKAVVTEYSWRYGPKSDQGWPTKEWSGKLGKNVVQLWMGKLPEEDYTKLKHEMSSFLQLDESAQLQLSQRDFANTAHRFLVEGARESSQLGSWFERRNDFVNLVLGGSDDHAKHLREVLTGLKRAQEGCCEDGCCEEGCCSPAVQGVRSRGGPLPTPKWDSAEDLYALCLAVCDKDTDDYKQAEKQWVLLQIKIEEEREAAIAIGLDEEDLEELKNEELKPLETIFSKQCHQVLEEVKKLCEAVRIAKYWQPQAQTTASVHIENTNDEVLRVCEYPIEVSGKHTYTLYEIGLKLAGYYLVNKRDEHSVIEWMPEWTEGAVPLMELLERRQDFSTSFFLQHRTQPRTRHTLNFRWHDERGAYLCEVDGSDASVVCCVPMDVLDETEPNNTVEFMRICLHTDHEGLLTKTRDKPAVKECGVFIARALSFESNAVEGKDDHNGAIPDAIRLHTSTQFRALMLPTYTALLHKELQSVQNGTVRRMLGHEKEVVYLVSQHECRDIQRVLDNLHYFVQEVSIDDQSLYKNVQRLDALNKRITLSVAKLSVVGNVDSANFKSEMQKCVGGSLRILMVASPATGRLVQTITDLGVHSTEQANRSSQLDVTKNFNTRFPFGKLLLSRTDVLADNRVGHAANTHFETVTEQFDKARSWVPTVEKICNDAKRNRMTAIVLLLHKREMNDAVAAGLKSLQVDVLQSEAVSSMEERKAYALPMSEREQVKERAVKTACGTKASMLVIHGCTPCLSDVVLQQPSDTYPSTFHVVFAESTAFPRETTPFPSLSFFCRFCPITDVLSQRDTIHLYWEYCLWRGVEKSSLGHVLLDGWDNDADIGTDIDTHVEWLKNTHSLSPPFKRLASHAPDTLPSYTCWPWCESTDPVVLLEQQICQYPSRDVDWEYLSGTWKDGFPFGAHVLVKMLTLYSKPLAILSCLTPKSVFDLLQKLSNRLRAECWVEAVCSRVLDPHVQAHVIRTSPQLSAVISVLKWCLLTAKLHTLQAREREVRLEARDFENLVKHSIAMSLHDISEDTRVNVVRTLMQMDGPPDLLHNQVSVREFFIGSEHGMTRQCLVAPLGDAGFTVGSAFIGFLLRVRGEHSDGNILLQHKFVAHLAEPQLWPSQTKLSKDACAVLLTAMRGDDDNKLRDAVLGWKSVVDRQGLSIEDVIRRSLEILPGSAVAAVGHVFRFVPESLSSKEPLDGNGEVDAIRLLYAEKSAKNLLNSEWGHVKVRLNTAELRCYFAKSWGTFVSEGKGDVGAFVERLKAVVHAENLRDLLGELEKSTDVDGGLYPFAIAWVLLPNYPFPDPSDEEHRRDIFRWVYRLRANKCLWNAFSASVQADVSSMPQFALALCDLHHYFDIATYTMYRDLVPEDSLKRWPQVSEHRYLVCSNNPHNEDNPEYPPYFTKVACRSLPQDVHDDVFSPGKYSLHGHAAPTSFAIRTCLTSGVDERSVKGNLQSLRCYVMGKAADVYWFRCCIVLWFVAVGLRVNSIPSLVKEQVIRKELEGILSEMERTNRSARAYNLVAVFPPEMKTSLPLRSTALTLYKDNEDCLVYTLSVLRLCFAHLPSAPDEPRCPSLKDLKTNGVRGLSSTMGEITGRRMVHGPIELSQFYDLASVAQRIVRDTRGYTEAYSLLGSFLSCAFSHDDSSKAAKVSGYLILALGVCQSENAVLLKFVLQTVKEQDKGYLLTNVHSELKFFCDEKDVKAKLGFDTLLVTSFPVDKLVDVQPERLTDEMQELNFKSIRALEQKISQPSPAVNPPQDAPLPDLLPQPSTEAEDHFVESKASKAVARNGRGEVSAGVSVTPLKRVVDIRDIVQLLAPDDVPPAGTAFYATLRIAKGFHCFLVERGDHLALTSEKGVGRATTLQHFGNYGEGWGFCMSLSPESTLVGDGFFLYLQKDNQWRLHITAYYTQPENREISINTVWNVFSNLRYLGIDIRKEVRSFLGFVCRVTYAHVHQAWDDDLDAVLEALCAWTEEKAADASRFIGDLSTEINSILDKGKKSVAEVLPVSELIRDVATREGPLEDALRAIAMCRKPVLNEKGHSVFWSDFESSLQDLFDDVSVEQISRFLRCGNGKNSTDILDVVWCAEPHKGEEGTDSFALTTSPMVTVLDHVQRWRDMDDANHRAINQACGAPRRLPADPEASDDVASISEGSRNRAVHHLCTDVSNKWLAFSLLPRDWASSDGSSGDVIGLLYDNRIMAELHDESVQEELHMWWVSLLQAPIEQTWKLWIAHHAVFPNAKFSTGSRKQDIVVYCLAERCPIPRVRERILRLLKFASLETICKRRSKYGVHVLPKKDPLLDSRTTEKVTLDPSAPPEKQYHMITKRFTKNPCLTHIVVEPDALSQGGYEIKDLLLKWFCEFTEKCPWRFIVFINAKTHFNVPETRDRICNYVQLDHLELVESASRQRFNVPKRPLLGGAEMRTLVLDAQERADCCLGLWGKAVLSTLEKEESCIILLITPPGAGKTHLMLNQAGRYGINLTRVDCSDYRLAEQSLVDFLSSNVSQPQEAGNHVVLVADEYHMLTKTKKMELLEWLRPNLSWLKVVIIGNRKNEEDLSIVKEFNLHMGSKKVETINGRLSLTLAHSLLNGGNDAYIGCFFGALRLIYGNEAVSLRLLDTFANPLQSERERDEVLTELLKDKLVRYGGSSPAEFVVYLREAYKDYAKGYEELQASVRSLVSDGEGFELIVTTAAAVALRWQQEERTEDEYDTLFPYEEFTQTEAFVSMHPARRLTAWVLYLFKHGLGMEDSDVKGHEEGVMRQMQELGIVHHHLFPYLYKTGQHANVSLQEGECLVLSTDGDFTNLTWMDEALQHQRSFNWDTVGRVWERSFVTDVEALGNILQRVPHHRDLVINALQPQNLKNLLSQASDSSCLFDAVLECYPTSKIEQELDSFQSPFMLAAWLHVIHQDLARWTASPCEVIEKLTERLPVPDTFTGGACKVIRCLLLLRWGSKFGGMWSEVPDKAKLRETALKKTYMTVMHRCAAELSDERYFAPDGALRDLLLPIWVGTFADFAKVQCGEDGLPLRVAFAVVQWKGGITPHVSWHPSLKRLWNATQPEGLTYEDTHGILRDIGWPETDNLSAFPPSLLGCILLTQPAGSLSQLPPDHHKRLLEIPVTVEPRNLPDGVPRQGVLNNMERALLRVKDEGDLKITGTIGDELRECFERANDETDIPEEVHLEQKPR